MLEDATDPAACNSPNDGLLACVRRTGSARGDGRMAPTLEETKTRPIRTTSVCQIGVLSEAPLPVPSRHTLWVHMRRNRRYTVSHRRPGPPVLSLIANCNPVTILCNISMSRPTIRIRMLTSMTTAFPGSNSIYSIAMSIGTVFVPSNSERARLRLDSVLISLSITAPHSRRPQDRTSPSASRHTSLPPPGHSLPPDEGGNHMSSEAIR